MIVYQHNSGLHNRNKAKHGYSRRCRKSITKEYNAPREVTIIPDETEEAGGGGGEKDERRDRRRGSISGSV